MLGEKTRKECGDMPVAALIKIGIGIGMMIWGAPAVFGG